jgi:hypothetical protein
MWSGRQPPCERWWDCRPRDRMKVNMLISPEPKQFSTSYLLHTADISITITAVRLCLPQCHIC